MRILVISQEVWREDKNGGNILSNIFSGIDAEFAQIYCSPGVPSNKICKKYYQMTDSMIIDNIIRRKKVGQIIELNKIPINSEKIINAVEENKKFYDFFRKFRFITFLIIKEILWSLSKWKTPELDKFILDFKPDIIFAPCYANHFMLNLDRYVCNLVKKPMISYISDDNYSLKQFSLHPLYWINRFILRRNIRNTFQHYDLTYTMTDEQMKECKEAFNCNIKILRKGINLSDKSRRDKVNSPIKIVYAGGIYLNRWKTLICIAKALQKINKNGVRIILEIYTGNKLSKKQESILNDGINSFVYGLVSQEELKKKYNESDIALHVESFDLKNRLITRLSFSTKITDCLSSGCAVLAICWKEHSGYKYLVKEDAAICIDDNNRIYKELLYIVENPEIIKKYSNKAYYVCGKNHKDLDVKNMIKLDFQEIIKGNRLS